MRLPGTYISPAETKLYYLQSRYYNPEIGRFINADAFVSTGQGISGNNMFAYCLDNPVSATDSSGHAAETVFDVISLVVSVYDVASNPDDVWAWIGLVGDLVDLVPFVTGVGEAVKLARAVDKIIDGFGGLSRAKEFGIMGYNALRKLLKGTGLQAHHIIEQRLVKHLGINVSDMLSVAVTVAEHQQFTKAWRDLIAYGTDYHYLDRQKLWEYAQKVYKNYPELLDAAYKILFD